jgi:hypothetical protein
MQITIDKIKEYFSSDEKIISLSTLMLIHQLSMSMNSYQYMNPINIMLMLYISEDITIWLKIEI